MAYNLITILGPTAVGKTKIAVLLADHFNGEIISADSRQVYKGMDIGTGKDLNEYKIGEKFIPYHLIDILSPGEEFNLFMFNKLFHQSYEQVILRMRIPFLVGGTGLYLHSVLKEYELNKTDFDKGRYEELNNLDISSLRELLKKLKPNQHNTTDLLIKDRIIKAILVAESDGVSAAGNNYKINSLNIGVAADREVVKENIAKRLKYRLENGMIQEVKKLVEEGITFEKLEFFGLEYKFIAMYLQGKLNYDELYEKLNIAIRQFAKRQMTWFRRMEKEGIKIHWINGADYKSAEKIIIQNYGV